MKKQGQQRAFPFMKSDVYNRPETRKARPSGWVGSAPYWNCPECGEPVFDYEGAKLYEEKPYTEEVETGSVINDDIINKFKQSLQEVISEFPGIIQEGFKSVTDYSTVSNLSSIFRSAIFRLIENKLDWFDDIFKSFGYTKIGQEIREDFYSMYNLPFNNEIEKIIEMNTYYGYFRDLSDQDKNKVLQTALGMVKYIPKYGDKIIQLLGQLKGFRTAYQRQISEKLPICDKCYEEEAFECDECDFATLDEDEIVEVEEKTWNQEKGKYDVETKYLCEEHGAKCPVCGKGVEKEDSDTIEHDGDYYHSDCFYEQYERCAECDEIIHREEGLYDEDTENIYCEQCYDDIKRGIAGSVGYEKTKQILGEIKKEIPILYPLDEKTILGNILPVLKSAYSKFGNEANPNWILKRIQKPDAKAAVGTELDRNTLSNAIESFESNVKYQQNMKKEYPDLKGYKPIPVDVKIEHPGGDHGGMVFALYPNDFTFKWADRIMPGAREVYDLYLSGKGHHSGAFGYVRISEDDGNIIIDNLQTDLDTQSFNKEYNSWENRYLDYKNRYERALEANAEDFTDYEKEQQEKMIKMNKESMEFYKEKSDNFKKHIPIVSWWFSTIKKFWAPYLLDVVKRFADDYGAHAYLTSFEMQEEKWSGIPERNKDIYEKIPEMMDMETEYITTKPEDLRRKEYLMRRVADDLFLMTQLFCKKAEEVDK